MNCGSPAEVLDCTFIRLSFPLGHTGAMKEERKLIKFIGMFIPSRCHKMYWLRHFSSN